MAATSALTPPLSPPLTLSYPSSHPLVDPAAQAEQISRVAFAIFAICATTLAAATTAYFFPFTVLLLPVAILAGGIGTVGFHCYQIKNQCHSERLLGITPHPAVIQQRINLLLEHLKILLILLGCSTLGGGMGLLLCGGGGIWAALQAHNIFFGLSGAQNISVAIGYILPLAQAIASGTSALYEPAPPSFLLNIRKFLTLYFRDEAPSISLLVHASIQWLRSFLPFELIQQNVLSFLTDEELTGSTVRPGYLSGILSYLSDEELREIWDKTKHRIPLCFFIEQLHDVQIQNVLLTQWNGVLASNPEQKLNEMERELSALPAHISTLQARASAFPLTPAERQELRGAAEASMRQLSKHTQTLDLLRVQIRPIVKLASDLEHHPELTEKIASSAETIVQICALDQHIKNTAQFSPTILEQRKTSLSALLNPLIAEETPVEEEEVYMTLSSTLGLTIAQFRQIAQILHISSTGDDVIPRVQTELVSRGLATAARLRETSLLPSHSFDEFCTKLTTYLATAPRVAASTTAASTPWDWEGIALRVKQAAFLILFTGLKIVPLTVSPLTGIAGLIASLLIPHDTEGEQWHRRRLQDPLITIPQPEDSIPEHARWLAIRLSVALLYSYSGPVGGFFAGMAISEEINTYATLVYRQITHFIST